MKYNILQNKINDVNIEPIIQSYVDNRIHYMREDNFDGWTYLTKDFLHLDRVEYVQLLQKMELLNNTILKKVVYHIMKNDMKALYKIGMNKEMVDIMDFLFKKWNYQTADAIPLSYYGRYDLLLNEENELKVVEINSETPAGFPEASTNEIIYNNANIDGYIDTNYQMKELFASSMGEYFDKMKASIDSKKNFLFTFIPACWEYFEIKKNEDGTIGFDQEYDEDYICAIHMTNFFYQQLTPMGMTVKLGNTDDIQLKEDGLYFEGVKQDYVWSFYPLEWFFTDKGATDFWKLYKEWKFEIVNNPLNLITQSKAIWAYIHENVKNNVDMGLTSEEIAIFLELVPEYRFSILPEESADYVSKPLYFREWVGIDNSDYLGTTVFQKRIKQKLLDINTFDGLEQGYLTLGLYMGETGFIGGYTRFCNSPITDYTAYYLPTVLDIEK